MFNLKRKKQQTVDTIDYENIPQHIGIIMDGNGRWAKRRGLPRSAGHAAGAKTLDKITRCAEKLGVRYVTVYAFSTENWKRPKDEVDSLMKLMVDYLDDYKRVLGGDNIRIRIVGRRDELSEEIIRKIDIVENATKDNDKITLVIALNYGGREELVSAARKIAEAVKSGRIAPEDIDEKMISDNIYTSFMPDPDFIIRPSGELRLSNFLLWQSAYSEFWFSDICWPDFTEADLHRAVIDFQKRNRRFGGV
ncbi:MAG: isoprenyl transferase [Clostridia bacterium]|nr:isoprenyl transferase [Clostridia bacterium]